MRLSLVTSPVVAAVVGFGGTLAVVLAAARAAGADAGQAASWVTGLCLAMAATSAVLSLRHRIPMVTAWSTPGAALIAASAAPIGMDAAVAAFLLCAGLILLTAAVKPLGDLVSRIPVPVASAMLAGVLLRFVVAAFESAQASPVLVLPLIALFLVMRLVVPVAAVLVVLAAGVGLAAALHLIGPLPDTGWGPTFVFVSPRFDPTVLVGLGVPLYLVTMASQNLPGFAVLKAAGYQPPVRSALAVTGIASGLTALMGAHTSNMAAITAALCTGPDVHPDPARRWPAGVAYGVTYLVFAACAGLLVAISLALPADLMKAVAGVALMTPLMGALSSALGDERQRFAAVLALVVTASGFTVAGVGSAFWGLVAGIGATVLEAAMRRRRP
jgi:benzoate membrane transport protein